MLIEKMMLKIPKFNCLESGYATQDIDDQDTKFQLYRLT